MALRQLADFRFPGNSAFLIGALNVPAAAVAQRCGLELEAGMDPERGPVVGFAVELASGRRVQVREFRIELEQYGLGASIEADVAEVAKGAADGVFGEAVEALELKEHEIALKPMADARLQALAWRAESPRP
jgi:hypothetical protein